MLLHSMLLHSVCLYVIAPRRETRLGRGGATMTPLSPPPPPVSVRQIYHSPYTLARTLLHALAWTACRAAGPIHHGTLPRVCAQQRGALPPVPGAWELEVKSLILKPNKSRYPNILRTLSPARASVPKRHRRRQATIAIKSRPPPMTTRTSRQRCAPAPHLRPSPPARPPRAQVARPAATA